MFLRNLMKKNANLLKSAVELHQDGMIPPNTWILDLDTIYDNARKVSSEAKAHNLKTYFMTKQIGRNPFAVKTALKAGINKVVAVDINGAKQLHRYNIPIGHLGHLSQVPKNDYISALKMKAEVITIYSLETAKALDKAAKQLNMSQDILIKVADNDGVFLPGQESGIMIDDFTPLVDELLKLKNINIAGLTAFPCVTYNNWATEDLELTSNVNAISRAKLILNEKYDITLKQINTPGNTSSETMTLFSDFGSTHVEPGHGITGTTPDHIYNPDAKEIPALVYVSEISHLFNDKAYAFGGGLYVCMGGGPLGYPVKALVGPTYDHAIKTKATWEQLPLDNIDYYGMLTPTKDITVGDTVLFGFRPQMFITRANVAAVKGIKSGNPEVLGIFDSSCNMLDDNHNVISPEKVNEIINRYLDSL